MVMMLQREMPYMNTETAMQIVHEVIERTEDGPMAGLMRSMLKFRQAVSCSRQKRRPVLHRVHMRAITPGAAVLLLRFSAGRDRLPELIGDDEVRILDKGGTILARRKNPRAAFKGIRRQFLSGTSWISSTLRAMRPGTI